MYIKIRKEQLRDKAKSTVLRFQIVRTYRDPVTRQVRSQLIAYLATIKESLCSEPIAQEQFWRKINCKLSRLSLAPDVETRLCEKLTEKVPRPRSWAEILAPYAGFSRRGAGIR